MQIRRIALSAALATTMAAVPLSAAKAQYYNPMCNPLPLTWPFCIAGLCLMGLMALTQFGLRYTPW